MVEPNMDITGMTRRLLEEHQPAHNLTLGFEQCGIEVRSNNESLIQSLRAYYEGFVDGAIEPGIVVHAIEAPPPEMDCSFTPQRRPSAEKKLKEEFADVDHARIVRKVRTGMVFIFGSEIQLAVGPCERNINQVINFINNRHIAWGLDRGRLLLHAAGVCEGGSGLGLAGISGAGKSTLALHLLNHGLSFVSNDRLLVSQDEQTWSMHGLAKMPRVNPGTLLHNARLSGILPRPQEHRFRQLPSRELWDLEEKYDVPIGRVYGPDRFHLQAQLCGLVILTWIHGDRSLRVHEDTLCKRPDLLPAIMKSPGVFYPRVGEPGTLAQDVDDYINVLGDCPVLEIAGGISFADAVEHSLAFLRRHAQSHPIA